MRRALLTAGLIAALAAPAAAHAEALTLAMPGKYFEPARASIVAGDTVTWRNGDFVTHDVRIPGLGLDSGPLGRNATWTQSFAAAGSFPFVCTLHPFMSGTLEVVNATVAAAPEGVLAGEPLTLTGRAPAGTAEVGLVRVDAGGTTTALPGAPAAADGTYTLTTPAVEGARYRVTTPRGDSPEIAPQVSAGVEARLRVRHRGRRLVARATTTPAAPGLFATLQLYDRWHYRWRGRRTVALDAEGAASFPLPRSRRTYARIVLRRGKHAAPLVFSGVVRTGDGRPAGDPHLIVPEHGGTRGGGTGTGDHGGH